MADYPVVQTNFARHTVQDGMWSGCPSLGEPSIAYGFYDDFMELGIGDATSRWTLDATNGTVTLGAAQTVGLGGVAVLNAPGADHDWASLKVTVADVGAPFKITKDSGKKLWAEFRVHTVEIVESCVYVGLFGEDCTEVGTDATGAENLGAAQDGLYFRCLLAAVKDDWDFCSAKNGDEEVIAADAQLAVAATWFTFGIYFDGVNTISGYINGVYVGEIAADHAKFPNDVGLTPLIFLKAGEAVAKSAYIDWVKVVQLR